MNNTAVMLFVAYACLRGTEMTNRTVDKEFKVEQMKHNFLIALTSNPTHLAL
jgi:hypothetical protein